MHKSKRLAIRAAKVKETKVQELAWAKTPEARAERKRMTENRHWFDRDPKGQLLTGAERGHGSVTVL